MQIKLLSRTLAVLLAVVMALTFASCKDDEDDPTITTDSTTNAELTEPTSEDEGETTSSEGTTKASSKTTTGTSGGSSAKTTQTTAKQTTAKKSNTYYAPQVLTNTASGTSVETLSDGTQIDYSNTSSGYVMIKYSGAHSNVRVQVTTPEGSTPTYPIFSTGWEAIPLTNGNGTYAFSVLANDGGSSYSVVGKVSISVTLSSSTAPFLRPNLFCNYDSSTACVSKAAELTQGCDTDVAKIEAIYNFVTSTFSYDSAKAKSVATAAYVPNLASVWSSKTGICFDYASTMTAMLRTQGLPTKVCVGYANGGTYHAWISVYVSGSGWVNGVIQFDGNSWKMMDPTWASSLGNNVDLTKKYSYSVKYYY